MKTSTGRSILLCTVADAAEMLGLGRSTVYELISRGHLSTVHIGTRNRIKIADVEKLAETGIPGKGAGRFKGS